MANLTYEMILMLDPESGDEQRDKIATDVKAKLEAGGDVLHEANWGLRKMAYEIDKRESADYRFFKFSAGKDLLDDFDHSLKITDGVLRFRIYKVDPRAPVIDPPPPLTFAAGSERPGGRSRRDEGREDRPPRAPDSADAGAAPPAEAPAAEAPQAEEAPAAEAPPADAAPAPAEPAAEAPAQAAEAPADAPEAPAEASEPAGEAPEANSAEPEQPAE
jgi:small subunit ribosomal protein S6